MISICRYKKIIIVDEITGEPQRELSLIGKKNTTRVINESLQWFDAKGKN